jgi:uncharacterized protein YbjT (DUF2867 family)
VLLEGFFLIFTADSVRESNQIRQPFGEGKTSPAAVDDVARVLATELYDPQSDIGKIYHLTGPQSENLHFYAQEYSQALVRTIAFHDIRRAVARRTARAWLAGSPGGPPRDNGGSARAGRYDLMSISSGTMRRHSPHLQKRRE